MPTAGQPLTAETERKNRLTKNRLTQTIARARQGFFDTPQKLRAAQREVFLPIALEAAGQKLPTGPEGQRRIWTPSGALTKRYTDRQLGTAEEQKNQPPIPTYASRFRNAAQKIFSPTTKASANDRQTIKSKGLLRTARSESTDEVGRKNQFLENMARTKARSFPTIPATPAIPYQPDEEYPEEEEEEENETTKQIEEEEMEEQGAAEEAMQNQVLAHAQQTTQAQQLAKNQQVTRQNQIKMAAAQSQNNAGQGSSKDNMVRRKAEKIIRRGVEEIAQFIGNALDLGTVGVSTIITIFMYAINLTDFSMQTLSFYVKNNKYLAFLFPPLDEWEPLPISTKMLPIYFLHAIIVLIDIIVIGFVVIAFTLILLIMFGPAIGLATLTYSIFGDQMSILFSGIFSSFNQ